MQLINAPITEKREHVKQDRYVKSDIFSRSSVVHKNLHRLSCFSSDDKDKIYFIV